MTFPKERIGYKGQKYRIVVTEKETGQVRRIGWSESNTKELSGLNTHPSWKDARYEEVTDPVKEANT